MGLVVNRPTEVQPKELLDDADAIPDYDGKLYRGGPVQMYSLRALLRTDTQSEDAYELVGSVHGVHIDDALKEAASDQTSVRFYIGYAGWAAGQLDHELARSSWRIQPASDEIVFAYDPELLWKRLLPAPA